MFLTLTYDGVELSLQLVHFGHDTGICNADYPAGFHRSVSFPVDADIELPSLRREVADDPADATDPCWLRRLSRANQFFPFCWRPVG